jgi:hypothetical protein
MNSEVAKMLMMAARTARDQFRGRNVRSVDGSALPLEATSCAAVDCMTAT